MVSLGLRITTFLTNTLVLTGYALIYEWLLRAKLHVKRHRELRQAYLAMMTVAFLLLFHFSSIFSRKLQEQVSHLDRVGSRWPVIL